MSQVPPPDRSDFPNDLRGAYDYLSAKVGWLEVRCLEAERLLRVAYADSHSEDVPVDVLTWLNP